MNRRRRTGSKKNSDQSEKRSVSKSKNAKDPTPKSKVNRRRSGAKTEVDAGTSRGRGKRGGEHNNQWRYSAILAYWLKLGISVALVVGIFVAIWWIIRRNPQHNTEVQVVNYSNPSKDDHWFSTRPYTRFANDDLVTRKTMYRIDKENPVSLEKLLGDELSLVSSLGNAGPDQNLIPIWLKALATTDTKGDVFISVDASPFPVNSKFQSADGKPVNGWVSLPDVLKKLSQKTSQAETGEDLHCIVFLDLQPIEELLYSSSEFELITQTKARWEIIQKEGNCKNLVVALPHSPGQRNWTVPGLGKTAFQFAFEKAVEGYADVAPDGKKPDEIVDYLELKNYLISATSDLTMLLSSDSNRSIPIFLEPADNAALSELRFCHVAMKKDAPEKFQVARHGVSGQDSLDNFWRTLEPQLDNWIHEDPLRATELVFTLIRMEHLWLQGRSDMQADREWELLLQRCEQLLKDPRPSSRVIVSLLEKYKECPLDDWREFMEVRDRVQQLEAAEKRAREGAVNESAADDGGQSSTKHLVDLKKTKEKLERSLIADPATPAAIWQYFASPDYNGRMMGADHDLKTSLNWYHDHLKENSHWQLESEIGNIDFVEIQFLKQLVSYTAPDARGAILPAIRCRALSDQVAKRFVWQQFRGEEENDLLGDFQTLESKRRSLEDRMFAGLNSNSLMTDFEALATSESDLSFQNLDVRIQNQITAIKHRNRKLFTLPFLYRFWHENRKSIAIPTFNGLAMPTIPLEPKSIFEMTQFGRIETRLKDGAESDTRAVCQLLLASPFLKASQRKVVREYFVESSQKIAEKVFAEYLNGKPGPKINDSAEGQWEQVKWNQKLNDCFLQSIEDTTFMSKLSFEQDVATMRPYLLSVSGGNEWASDDMIMRNPTAFAAADEHNSAWGAIRGDSLETVELIAIDRVLDDFWGPGEVRTEPIRMNRTAKPYFELITRQLLPRVKTTDPEDRLNKLINQAKRYETANSSLSVTFDEGAYEIPSMAPFVFNDPSIDKDAVMAHQVAGARHAFNATTGTPLHSGLAAKQSSINENPKHQVFFRGHIASGNITLNEVVIAPPKEKAIVQTEYVDRLKGTSATVKRVNPMGKRVAILVDCSASMNDEDKKNLKPVKRNLRELLKRLAEENAHDVSLIFFGATVADNRGGIDMPEDIEAFSGLNDFERLGEPMTSDDTIVVVNNRRLNQDSLDQFLLATDKIRGWGYTPLYAAMSNTVNYFEDRLDHLLVITDGEDMWIKKDPNTGERDKNGEVDSQMKLENYIRNKNRPDVERLFYVGKNNNAIFDQLRRTTQGNSLRQEFNAESVLQLYQFPQLVFSHGGEPLPDFNVDSTDIPYELVDDNVSQTVTRFQNLAKELIGESIVVSDQGVQGKGRNQLEMSFRRGDQFGITLDETSNQLQFDGPDPSRRIRSSDTAKSWTIGQDTYRVEKKQSKDANDSLMIELWNVDQEHRKFTRHPSRVCLWATPRKIMPGNPAAPRSFLIQDAQVKNLGNVIELSFPSFELEAENTPKSIGSKQWDLRLVTWPQDSPPMGKILNGELGNAFPLEGEPIQGIEGVLSLTKKERVRNGWRISVKLALSEEAPADAKIDSILVDLVSQLEGKTGYQNVQIVSVKRKFMYEEQSPVSVLHEFIVVDDMMRQLGNQLRIRLLPVAKDQAIPGAGVFDFSLNQ